MSSDSKITCSSCVLHWFKGKLIVLILLALTVVCTLLFRQFGLSDYTCYKTDTLHYSRAKVLQIIEENLKYDNTLEIYTGTQKLLVQFLEGQSKGKQQQVINYITNTQNVVARQNSTLIIKEDTPANVTPYYTVHSYDRTLSLTGCILLLFAAILGVGGKKGLRAIAALLYSLFLIIYWLLPMVYSGYPPILVTLFCAALSTAVTLLFLNGQSKKTYAAIISTVVGMMATALFFWLVSAILSINGFSADASENLLLIHQGTGLKIKNLLFAGVLVASLGAVMDVAMSVVSSLSEINRHSPDLPGSELFRSGLAIGRDVIGTMTNTLILAFAGSAFITLLIFVSYNVQFSQLWNSDYLAIEIAQGISGTFGIVITVPVASAVSAVSFKRLSRKR